MSRDEIIAQLMPLMRDVFDDDDLIFREDLSAADVEDWDSLSDVRLMVTVEKAFRTRFPSAEWEGLRKLGDLVDLLARR